MNKVNVNRIVRIGEIKRLESKGYNVEYDIIEVAKQDIVEKNEKAKLLHQNLKELLLHCAIKYNQMPFSDNEEDKKRKLDALIDLEQVIKTIAWISNKSWQDVWDRAKLGTMQGFKRHARVGEPNLMGCVKEYLQFEDIEDLSYIETALFDELKRFNSNPMFYIKFQNKVKAKKKAQGGYKSGYYLKSYEAINEKNF